MHFHKFLVVICRALRGICSRIPTGSVVTQKNL